MFIIYFCHIKKTVFHLIRIRDSMLQKRSRNSKSIFARTNQNIFLMKYLSRCSYSIHFHCLHHPVLLPSSSSSPIFRILRSVDFLLTVAIAIVLATVTITNKTSCVGLSSVRRSTARSSTTMMNNSKGIGVCRVEVARVEWDALQPWQRSPQMSSTGTAFVIDDITLLTNAHVVKSAIDIRVRPHGSTRRFPAKVVTYGPDVDLALLEISGTTERADFRTHLQQISSKSKSNSNPSSSSSTQEGIKDDDNEGGAVTTTTAAADFAMELPALQETVHVVGFPTGGRTICVTEGVVSRIDLYNRIVAIQVDSAINPGNSGGPAFNSKGQVTGVAFRKRVSSKSQKIDNIGYLIPSVIVRAFLDRIVKDRTITGTEDVVDRLSASSSSSYYKYQLSGTTPYRCHSLENHSLRLAHNVPDSIHGVLITSVAEIAAAEEDGDGTNNNDKKLVATSNTTTTNNGNNDEVMMNEATATATATVSSTLIQRLLPGDILTKIDDKDVADDGQVILRGNELIQHEFLMRVKTKDEPVTFTVYRNGETVTCDPYYLKDIQPIISRWDDVDYMPNYMILGSLVLLPAFHGMRHSNNCGFFLKADIIEQYRKWPREWPNATAAGDDDKNNHDNNTAPPQKVTELVILTQIYAHELSFSYVRAWRRVVRYNGIIIRSLEHLQELWSASCNECTIAAASTPDTAAAAAVTAEVEEGTHSSAGTTAHHKFVRLELENDDDIVFEVNAAMKAQKEVMMTNAISKPYNLKPPNPKYIF